MALSNGQYYLTAADAYNLGATGGTIPPPTATVLATPTGLQVSRTSPTSAYGYYTAVAAASGYRVQLATNSAFTQNVAMDYQGPATEFNISALTAATPYYFRVQALGNGTTTVESPYSPAVVVSAVGPHDPSADFNGLAGFKTGSLTGVRYIGMWLKLDRTRQSYGANDGGFLFDARQSENNTPILAWTAEGFYHIEAYYVDGVAMGNGSSVTDLSTLAGNVWRWGVFKLDQAYSGTIAISQRFAYVDRVENVYALPCMYGEMAFYSDLPSAAMLTSPTYDPSPTDANLLAMYDWRNVSGTSVPDISGNNRTGTIQLAMPGVSMVTFDGV